MSLREAAVGALLTLSAILLATTNAAGQNWCDIPDGEKPRVVDRLVIGAFGMFPVGDNCPPLDGNLGHKFQYPAQRLQVVMRLEGAKEFILLPKALEPIRVRLSKEHANFTMSYMLDIGNPFLNTDDALGETEIKSDYFDWQFDVNFNTIIRPGIYTLKLTQANENLCLADGQCQIVFEILE